MKYKIYELVNNVNNNKYIGWTWKTLLERFLIHKMDSKKIKNKNIKLYKNMNEIGFHNFNIHCIEEIDVDDKYAARNKEREYIHKFDTINNGYNWNLPIITNDEKQEYKKKYRHDHNEYYKIKFIEFCNKHKDKLMEKIKCDICGGEYTYFTKFNHNKWKKHMLTN